MNAENLTVDMRLSNKAESKLKAFADVTIPLGSDGVLKISGFSVIQVESQPARVVPPARKGEFRYFDTVSLIGKIRAIVDQAVLTEYDRLKGATS